MRFSDDIDTSIGPDFIPRKHNKPITRLLALHALVIVVAAVCIYFVPQNIQPYAGAIILVSLLGLAAYTVLHSQQNNDMRMATEFENMLFSAAISLGSSFCFFVKRDGTIVYSDDGTQSTFPRFAYEEGRALDTLFEEGNVSKTDAERVYSALTNATKEKLVFPISQPDGTRSEFIVIVEPLRRPAGYFVVRGRPYYSDRVDSVKMPTSFGIADLEKVEALLTNLSAGVYITDAQGSIEYCNETLEKMTGFTSDELVESKSTLMKLIYEADGYSMGEFGVTDYVGTILLQRKIGSLARAHLHQTITRDQSGKVSGCIAQITEQGLSE